MRLSLAIMGVLLSVERAFAQGNPNLNQIDLSSFSISAFTSVGQILNSIISFLAGSIIWVGAAMFGVGGLMMVFGGGSEKSKSWGKDLMIGSIVGIGVVLGAYAIYQTVVWIVYLA